MEKEVIISQFEKNDADDLFEMIQETLSSTDLLTKVYEKNTFEIWCSLYTKKYLIGSSLFKHIYIAKMGEKVVGCAACELTADSVYVSMVYINPNVQGKGIGRKLLQAVEKDEYCKQKERITLSAALSAIKFYQKFGYHYRTEFPEIDVDCGIEVMHLEKNLRT